MRTTPVVTKPGWTKPVLRALGLAILAGAAIGLAPVATADPASDCPQGRTPGPGPGCGRHAFLADVRAAGIEDSNGDSIEVSQGLDLCGVMDSGVSRENITSQFAELNPGLGPDGAARVVGIAIRDLCPWHG